MMQFEVNHMENIMLCSSYAEDQRDRYEDDEEEVFEDDDIDEF